MTNKEYFDSTVKEVEDLELLLVRLELDDRYDNNCIPSIKKAICDALGIFGEVYKNTLFKMFFNFTKNRCYFTKPLFDMHSNHNDDCTYVCHKDGIAITRLHDHDYRAQIIDDPDNTFNGIIHLDDLPKNHPYYKHNISYSHIEFAMVAYCLTVNNEWDEPIYNAI